MKIKALFLIPAFLVLFQSCALFPKRQASSTNAIHNAVMDFSKTRRFHKKDSVFQVTFHPEVYKWIVTKKVGGGIETAKGKVFQGMKAISIFPNVGKFLLSADVKVGLKGMIVPSRFIEVNDKLYLWWDADYPLTQELLDVLDKYHLLQDDEGGILTLPDGVIIHSHKSVDYYYCKDSPYWYKRVFINKIMGDYEPPPLKCKP